MGVPSGKRESIMKRQRGPEETGWNRGKPGRKRERFGDKKLADRKRSEGYRGGGGSRDSEKRTGNMDSC